MKHNQIFAFEWRNLIERCLNSLIGAEMIGGSFVFFFNANAYNNMFKNKTNLVFAPHLDIIIQKQYYKLY